MENEVNDIVLFFGRFHPIIVHLPIGFLLLGIILHFISKCESFKKYAPVVDFTLFLGGISGVIACILGYMLSLEGGYNEDAVMLHQWFGIGLTVLSFIMLGWRRAETKNSSMVSGGFASLLILLTFTGHLGGNLTHGSNYLFQYAPNPVRTIAGLPPKINKTYKKITNIDSALVFEDIIQPILDARCVSCHNEDKLKGELLMTTFDHLMKGGESGAVIVAGNSISSDLIHRVTLAPDDEDFMPPEGKTPLSKEQIKLLEWWIDEGAKPNASLQALNAGPEIRDQLEKYLSIGKYMTILNTPIDPVKASIIEDLESSGFMVSVLAEKVNYLDVSVKPGIQLTKKELETLKKAKDNIVWLDLKNSGIKDDNLSILSDLPNLLKLRLDHNDITDKGAAHLTKLTRLEYINLSFTKISDQAISDLHKIKSLKKVYYYNTAVKEAGV